MATAITTNQAVTQEAYGSADVLRLGQLPVPEIKDNEVLVRVGAAGLDRGTWHIMTGKPYLLRLAFGLRKPKNPVPGRALAGTVVAVGSAVNRFSTGDEVYGVGHGSFAQYCAAPESKLARKPANTSFEAAAVIPISGHTAQQALTDVGKVQAGQKVLIIGASGGVGCYAVQLAKAFGAEVTGVASTAKLDLVRSVGADHVIDYTKEDFADGVHHYDLIIDIAGNPKLSRLRSALTPTGTAVITGGEDGDNVTGGMGRQLRALITSWFSRQRVASFIGNERGSELERLTTLIEEGKLKPTIDKTYPLTDAAEAMRLLEAGRVRGKIAITL